MGFDYLDAMLYALCAMRFWVNDAQYQTFD